MAANIRNSDKYTYCPDYDEFFAKSKQKMYKRLLEHLQLREPMIKRAVENTIDELKRLGYRRSPSTADTYNASFISIAAINKLIEDWEGPVISAKYKRKFHDPDDETAEMEQAKFNKDAINWLDQSSYRVTGAAFFAPHLQEIRQYLTRYCQCVETETESEKQNVINYSCVYFAVQLLSSKTRFKRSKLQPVVRHKTLVNSKPLHAAFKVLYKQLDLDKLKEAVKRKQRERASTTSKKQSKGSKYRVKAAEFAANVDKLCRGYLAREKEKLGVELEMDELQRISDIPLCLQEAATDAIEHDESASQSDLDLDVDSDENNKDYEPSDDFEEDIGAEMEVDDEADSSNSHSSVAVRPPPKPRPPSPELEIASHSNSSATTTISAPYDYAPPQLPLSARTKTEETAKGCLHTAAHRGHTHYNCVCSRPSSPRSAPEEDDSAPPPAHREHAPPHNVNIHQHHSSLPPMVNNQPPLADSKPESGIIYIPVTQMVPVRVDEYGRILPASQLPSSYTYAYPPPLAAHAQIYGHGGYAPSRGGLHIGYAREYRHAPYARYVDERPPPPPHEQQTERMELPPAIATAASHLDEAAQSSMTNLLPLPLPSLPIHNAMHSSFQPPFMDDHSITSSDAATAMSQSGGRIRNMDNTSSLSFAAPNVMNANFRPY